MRPRCAPIAARTASSCCRAAPRANNRIDTFPHPIASNSVTAPNSRYSVPLILLITQSFSPSTFTLKFSGKRFGVSLANCSTSGCNAASATSWVTPRLRRRSTTYVGAGSCVSINGT